MQTLGIVDIIWKGRAIPVEKGAKFKPGGMMNTAVPLSRGVGRAQGFTASEVTATTVLERGQRFGNLYATDEGELQVVCDTGQTFVIHDAFLTDMPDVTGGEGGKIELKWSGGAAEEIL